MHKEKFDFVNSPVPHYIRLVKKHWWSRWKIQMDGYAPELYTKDNHGNFVKM